MFDVYIEDFGSVYEPAEGGYYVEVSTVSLWNTFDSAQNAQIAVNQENEGLKDVVFFDENARYDYDTGEYDSDGYPITKEAYAEFICEVDCSVNHHYIGDGYRFICIENGNPEPCPETYLGYR